MIERVIENWLIKASEKSYQIPFCYMLEREGFDVIHVSRHCAMELGKDIIAVSPDGVPCAYQLKGGDISLRKWREEIVNQVQDLVLGDLGHPAIDSSIPHRAYLVTNGKLEEEVSRAIGDLNRAWKQRGQPRLRVIVGRSLLRKALNLYYELWPIELGDERQLIELYLRDGREIFPKSVLAELLESTLPFRSRRGKRPSKVACQRAISSSALITSIAAANHKEMDNYIGEIEAWTVYIAYVLAIAERWTLSNKYHQAEINLALDVIRNALGNLAHEVKDRKHLVEGKFLLDEPFYRIRITWLMGFLSIYGLWRRQSKIPEEEIDHFIKEFTTEREKDLLLWGEAAIPQFLSYYWYLRFSDSTTKPDSLLYTLIGSICTSNKPRGQFPLPNPYYEAKELLPHIIDAKLKDHLSQDRRLAGKPIETVFSGTSYTLKALLHLYVRRNWRQAVGDLWGNISKIAERKLAYKKAWHFYRWTNQEGSEITIFPKHEQSWSALRSLAQDASGEEVPNLLKNYPIFVLLFLSAYPHRMNASLIRWLDTELRRLIYST